MKNRKASITISGNTLVIEPNLPSKSNILSGINKQLIEHFLFGFFSLKDQKGKAFKIAEKAINKNKEIIEVTGNYVDKAFKLVDNYKDIYKRVSEKENEAINLLTDIVKKQDAIIYLLDTRLIISIAVINEDKRFNKLLKFIISKEPRGIQSTEIEKSDIEILQKLVEFEIIQSNKGIYTLVDKYKSICEKILS